MGSKILDVGTFGGGMALMCICTVSTTSRDSIVLNHKLPFDDRASHDRRLILSVTTSPWPNDPHPLLNKRSSPVELTRGKLSMSQKKISSGVVHEVPADLKKALASNPQALAAWEDITPLARNEWICWIESARKAETRSRRIAWGCSSLKDGKRRPCCWPGCAHR